MILSDPDDMTVFLDDDAFFFCVTQDSSSFHWRLNGTDYNDLSSDVQDDLIISSSSTGQSELIELIITARAEYNETRVQCVIESNDGDSVVSDNATLYVQGKLILNIKSITIYCVYFNQDCYHQSVM